MTADPIPPDQEGVAGTGSPAQEPDLRTGEPAERHGGTLLRKASRAAFWNAVLLPLISAVDLCFAIVIRQRFQLDSGIYDAVLGLLATILFYSSLGIPTSLTKFLPELEHRAGPRGARIFLRRALGLRLALLAVVLVPLNLFAGRVVEVMNLGPSGVLYLRLLTGLVVGRSLLELTIKALNAFFAQLRANILQLAQRLLDFALVAAVLVAGYDMGGVLGALVASGCGLGLFGLGWIAAVLSSLEQEGDQAPAPAADPRPTDRQEAEKAATRETPRFLGFALFTWVYELGLYFSGAGFASPALAIVLGVHDTALFTTAFKLSLMTVGLMVSGFRGLYRPIFTRLRTRNDPAQLQRAFRTLTKAQLVLLIPAGVGLGVMAADYLPLMFGEDFLPAVPVARVLVALMFTETTLNLGIIVLSIDERYRAVLWTQSVLVVAAPFFVIVAAQYGLTWAAVLFGGARVVATSTGYLLCRRAYGFRFPWSFGARVAAVSTVMGLVVAAIRSVWATSVPEAITATLVGAVVFAVGARFARLLGPEEAELLERAQLPGQRWILRLLTPAE